MMNRIVLDKILQGLVSKVPNNSPGLSYYNIKEPGHKNIIIMSKDDKALDFYTSWVKEKFVISGEIKRFDIGANFRVTVINIER